MSNIKFFAFAKYTGSVPIYSVCGESQTQEELKIQVSKVLNQAKNFNLRPEERQKFNTKKGCWFCKKDNKDIIYLILCSTNYPERHAFAAINLLKQHMQKLGEYQSEPQVLFGQFLSHPLNYMPKLRCIKFVKNIKAQKTLIKLVLQINIYKNQDHQSLKVQEKCLIIRFNYKIFKRRHKLQKIMLVSSNKVQANYKKQCIGETANQKFLSLQPLLLLYVLQLCQSPQKIIIDKIIIEIRKYKIKDFFLYLKSTNLYFLTLNLIRFVQFQLNFVPVYNQQKVLLQQKMIHTQIKKFFSYVRILKSNTNDIFFNLATEQYLFEKQNLQTPTLFLWRNDKTIVIGRHQNPWKQCKIQKMKQNNIQLSRRKTGGGAVYQDLGNSCFSFLTPYGKDQNYDYKTVNNRILVKGLKDLGVEAQVSGRNDIHCEGKKISGSAYRLNLGGKQGAGRKALHHGTVMFNVDLGALQNHLNPNKKKLQSKGIDSVISRVMNLNQRFPTLNHDKLCQTLSKAFQQQHNLPTVVQTLNYDTLKQIEDIKQNFQRLKGWDWRFGQCPSFKYSIQKKFSWGLIQITYNVQNGIIKQGKIYSDCLFPDFISGLNQSIVGVKYDRQGLQKYGQQLLQKWPDTYESLIKDTINWMIEQL